MQNATRTEGDSTAEVSPVATSVVESSAEPVSVAESSSPVATSVAESSTEPVSVAEPSADSDTSKGFKM